MSKGKRKKASAEERFNLFERLLLVARLTNWQANKDNPSYLVALSELEEQADERWYQRRLKEGGSPYGERDNI